jgi:Cu-Zn family superoxide dismutase
MTYAPVAVFAATLAFSVAAFAQDQEKAKASFIGADGKEIGTAELTGHEDGVLVAIEVKGLPASQWVAFHVHQTGSCDHTTGHESAGGHFNPTDRQHGYLAEDGPHAGDMPNQYVPTDGTLRAQVFNSFVTLKTGDNAVAGKALMIHANADDYAGQPSGNAGKRLACAVIE